MQAQSVMDGFGDGLVHPLLVQIHVRLLDVIIQDPMFDTVLLRRAHKQAPHRWQSHLYTLLKVLSISVPIFSFPL